jgi:hypothetical protein
MRKQGQRTCQITVARPDSLRAYAYLPRSFAARISGLAFGLALAVRPAGVAEAPGSTARRRRVPRSGMRSTVEAGGAAPDNARRSVPVAVTPLLRRCNLCEYDGLVLADGRGTGSIRRAPHAAVTGATGRGSSARLVGFRPKGVTKAAAPPTALPRPDPGRQWRATLAAHHSPACSHPIRELTSRPSGPARRRCALDAITKLNKLLGGTE